MAPSLPNRILIGGSWVVMAVLLVANGVLGIELVREAGLNPNLIFGISPFIVGSALSFLTQKSRWKKFFERYTQS